MTLADDASKAGGREVLIGDPAEAAIFVPQIKLTRWNGEASLTLRVPEGVMQSGVTSFVDNEVLHKEATIGFYAMPGEGDLFKIGYILYQKPLTNKLTFQLEGWEAFDFFYQPPLKNVNPDGSTWEDHDGGGRFYRPVDVNGSYAIYHRALRGRLGGQTDYGTGKFAHYFKPRFIDADGRTVWAENLNITDGIVTVAIPQTFLNSARYPVRANDTLDFGRTAIGASTDTPGAGYFTAASFGQTTGAGDLTCLHVCAWVNTTPINIKLAAYTNGGTNPPGSGAAPDDLVSGATTGAISVSRTTKPTQASEWASGNVTGALDASTYYWFGFDPEATLYVAYDGSQPDYTSLYAAVAYANFPPAQAPAFSGHLTVVYSCYGTYTESGGGLSIPVAMAHYRQMG
jgi:hypothetical protein